MFNYFLFFVVIVVTLIIFILFKDRVTHPVSTPQVIENLTAQLPSPFPSIHTLANTTLETAAPAKTLINDYHTFQTFNNCGPAALSMTLSYFGINISQQQLGQDLRPYQIPNGNNDDKSVTLAELAEKAKEYNLLPYHRPNGNIEIIKAFINYDIPVIARTWLREDEDIGHYRIIKGYDDPAEVLIQDDSYQGKNLRYKYTTFNALWKKFNYEYLVLVPAEKKQIAENILGSELAEKVAWEKAVESAIRQLTEDPNDVYARFNLSIAYYHIENYQKAVEEFEKVENTLSFRTLWYQIEPIQAYFYLGNYQRVFEISDRILNNGNRAFSELYMLRGDIYLKQGSIEAAKQEFKKAVLYNKNFASKIPQI